MTLQEAKNEVAKNYGYSDWWSIDFTKYNEQTLRDEVSIVYARSKWDEACEEMRTEFWSRYMAEGALPMHTIKPEFKPN